jgi:hypothetical protein
MGDLDELDDFVGFMAQAAKDSLSARKVVKSGPDKGTSKSAFTDRELASLMLQRGLLLESVEKIKAALIDHPDQQELFKALRRSLSAAAIIASHQLVDPAGARQDREGAKHAWSAKGRTERSLELDEIVARYATPILRPDRTNNEIAGNILRKVNNDYCDPVGQRAIANRIARLRKSITD